MKMCVKVGPFEPKLCMQGVRIFVPAIKVLKSRRFKYFFEFKFEVRCIKSFYVVIKCMEIGPNIGPINLHFCKDPKGWCA